MGGLSGMLKFAFVTTCAHRCLQAPLPTTFHPFLMAILTRSATFKHAHLFGVPSPQNVKHSPPGTAIIVQLTGLFEGTVAKADQYLPYVP